MDSKGKVKKNRYLHKQIVLQSITIVIISVMSFLLIDFFKNAILQNNWNYDPIDGIGMIGPMSLLMWFFSYKAMKISGKHMEVLMNGLSQVADGNFNIRLDLEAAEPIKDLYKNFNKMISELQEVQTLRDDFINHFSHEFKTPISSINGFATLLLEENITKEEQKEYLGIIARESGRLSALSDSALLLTKLESQHFVLNSEEYQLDEQIKECIILLMPQMNKKSIEISVELPSVKYYGNANLMKHIWINLLSNAVKYSDYNGKIKIELREKRNTAVVAISDSGKGMGEETKRRAFEKYYQDEGEEKQSGIGLGLTIVKKIVDLVAGRIEIGNNEGKGCKFSVFLPEK